jgi:beta-N-acetylhexosaminidase
MSEVERLAAACIFPSFPGLEAPDWVLRRIEAGLGGICLFAYNVGDPEQLAALTASLRAVRGDLLIGIDEEGGDVTRLEAGRGSSYPGNAALGYVDDESLTERVAASIGADLAAVGVNLNFAPVADVNVNPDNPVIGIRSFGADAGLVARHVAAFVSGLQARGVAACAKHFPGHGSTAQDSHLELPTVTDDVRDGLEPFRAAIAAGVQTIMTAHVRVPALDDAPATLSPAVVGGLLREELGYDGLVIADALEMKAVSATVGVARSAVRALVAGGDAVLIGHDLGLEAVAAAQSALVDAVAEGELDEARLREAAARVVRTGAWASAPVGGSADREAGRVAARAALELDGKLGLDGDPLVVELRPQANIAAGEAEHSLAAALAGRFPATEALVLDEAAADPARISAARDGRSLVVVVRDAHRHPWMRDLAERLEPSLVVEVGLPQWRPRGSAYAATHGGSRVSFEVLAGRLLEESGVRA